MAIIGIVIRHLPGYSPTTSAVSVVRDISDIKQAHSKAKSDCLRHIRAMTTHFVEFKPDPNRVCWYINIMEINDVEVTGNVLESFEVTKSDLKDY